MLHKQKTSIVVCLKKTVTKPRTGFPEIYENKIFHFLIFFLEKTPDFGYFSQYDDWAKRLKVHQKLGSGTCGLVWEGKNIFIFI